MVLTRLTDWGHNTPPPSARLAGLARPGTGDGRGILSVTTTEERTEGLSYTEGQLFTI